MEVESRTSMVDTAESKRSQGSSRFRMFYNSSGLRTGANSLLARSLPAGLPNPYVPSREQAGQEADAKLPLAVCNLYPCSLSFQEASFW